MLQTIRIPTMSISHATLPRCSGAADREMMQQLAVKQELVHPGYLDGSYDGPTSNDRLRMILLDLMSR